MKRLAALVLGATLALSGCGAAATLTAAESAPSLRASLTRVDGALAHHQYAAARKQLEQLVAQARAAERKGSLSSAAAERIIGAATELLAQLPKPSQPSSTSVTPQYQAPTPTYSPSSTPSESPSAKPSPSSATTPTPHPKSPRTTPPPPAPTPTPTPTPDPTPSPTITPAAMSTPTP